MRKQAKEKLEKQVADFNAKYPPGTRVAYWPGAREGDGVESVTRSKAYVFHGWEPVVWVEGHGCIALTHIQVLQPTEAK